MRFGDTGAIPNFFKGLLSETYIPIIETWKPGQNVFEGRLYLYNGTRIIRALQTSGGRLSAPDNIQATWRDGVSSGRWFEVVGTYTRDEYKRGITQKYKSKSQGWSREDHYWLGQYCRYFKDVTGVDIMPAYNCWDGGEMDNAGLYASYGDNGTNIYSAERRDGMRTLTVPIRPYRDYTILLECPTEVLMAIALTKNGLFVTDDADGRNKTFGSGYRFMRMNVFAPQKISIGNEVTGDSNIAANLIEYLTLLIQVPETTTRIYVMEGDFTTQASDYEYGAEESPENKKEAKLVISANSMLTPYLACPDRLIEYLAESPITYGQFEESIAKVQDIVTSDEFRKVSGTYYRKSYNRGQWDSEIRRFIKSIFDKPFNGHGAVTEQMGDVVKEIERYLWEVKNV